MDAWREKLANLVNSLSTKRKLLIRIAILVALPGAIATFAKLYPFDGVGEWTGIGKDSNKSVTTEQEINPKTKEVIKITKKETENFQSAKTLWDWLGLAGAIAIPFALLYFERAEQRRSDKRAQEEKEQAEEQAKREKEIADNNLREQALEAYIDRMSELLIDKNLKVLIGKKLEESDPEYQKLDAAFDIARARTLSVLRRLDKDGERKGSVIRFLIDAELISDLLDLSDANLRGANLRGAYLRGAYLRGANLRGAYLVFAFLSEADLSDADLSDANLSRAFLSGADLIRAFLSEADLSDADLRGANLSEADLSDANLSEADLSDADLRGAKNLNPEQVKSAKNWEKAKYSEEFRAQLGLPPEPSK
jgi:uncharacterized protein YjbI with pentapeptide repeats